jgi:eukaryotic-like serine/threonine-protein kinase
VHAVKVRTATDDRLLPETRIGDYQIVSELEQEESGVVYLATHVVLPRRVTLKVMHAGSAWLRSLAIKVLREACLLEALHHAGIPRVFECGVLPDRRPWTAFELIEGTTVAETLGHGPMSLVDVVGMLRDVADLLAHAHGRGVVHRHLITDAIVRTPDRGFAYAVTHWDNALTLDTHSRVELDTRDDVFALGVIAFRALTGAMPDVQTTAECVPAAPPELASLIDQMLASEPVARPTSAEVRDRARWLADTLEPLMLEQVRWTPPPGSLADKIPVPAEPSGGFAIRISRTRSS